MKNAIKLIKSKKGSAIEMAMAMSIVVFAICTILLAIIGIGLKQQEKMEAEYSLMSELEEIGYAFLDWANGGDDSEFDSDIYNPDLKYNITASRAYLLVEYEKKTLLKVVLKESTDGDGNTRYRVSSWRYGF